MSQRQAESNARSIINFIADHEPLAATLKEFSNYKEASIRSLLREIAEKCESIELTTCLKNYSDIKVLTPKQNSLAFNHRKNSAEQTMRVLLHTDGASRGNPGPAAAGWVISTPDGHIIKQNGIFLGNRTNNEAEYEAVIHGLSEAMKLGANEVALRADSELLIKQITGVYKVRNQRMLSLYKKVRELIDNLLDIDARHVPREQNSAADSMANKALDKALSR
ncbi:MAG: ribonuclease HI family protein [Deltaproteobacteria bacterium]|nr:ribonuclease HI family protein [Deltaproteobacteria bacterium]